MKQSIDNELMTISSMQFRAFCRLVNAGQGKTIWAVSSLRVLQALNNIGVRVVGQGGN